VGLRVRAERLLVGVARLYFAYLAFWLVLHLLVGEPWWWLWLMTVLAEYAFAGLLLVLGIAVLVRRTEVWVGLTVSAALGIWMFGGLFVPKPAPAFAAGRDISVMTYNLLGEVREPGAVLRTIRAAKADLVALQEVNPQVAEAIRTELAEEYPHQVLDARRGVFGMGTISRYPLRDTGQKPGGFWSALPQVLEMDVHGRPITVINAHPVAPYAWGHYSEQLTEQRQTQVRGVAELVRASSGPVLICIDLNSTDRTVVYRTVSQGLHDTWREAGWGPGHSWSLMRELGWWFRIDYIFTSDHFRILRAEHGEWDGNSDHRPVVARLTLRP
jgi:vancomycin resistance protein VanJ